MHLAAQRQQSLSQSDEYLSLEIGTVTSGDEHPRSIEPDGETANDRYVYRECPAQQPEARIAKLTEAS